MKENLKYTQGLEFLAERGLNIIHVFDTEQIADLITPALPQIDLSRYPRTVLTASAGMRYWQNVQDSAFANYSNPVDEYSVYVSQNFVETFLCGQSFLLYPSDLPIPLGSVGLRSGWSFQSPMGISIHPEFGTWFAYRTLLLVEDELPCTKTPAYSHPCDECDGKPCISICPSGAVGPIGEFGLEACGRYRISDQSSCAYTCKSRFVCPVGTKFRYVPDQVYYHYNRSRKTMSRYYKD